MEGLLTCPFERHTLMDGMFLMAQGSSDSLKTRLSRRVSYASEYMGPRSTKVKCAPKQSPFSQKHVLAPYLCKLTANTWFVMVENSHPKAIQDSRIWVHALWPLKRYSNKCDFLLCHKTMNIMLQFIATSKVKLNLIEPLQSVCETCKCLGQWETPHTKLTNNQNALWNDLCVCLYTSKCVIIN